MGWGPLVGTAKIDLLPAPGTSPHGRAWCIFECADPFDLTKPTMAVEMNVDVDGKFHAHQNHPEFEHQGGLIAAERVRGVAHVDCYRLWYEQTYRSPFTMTP